MAKSLGIFVSSNKHLDKIIKLCKAAKKKGCYGHYFFHTPGAPFNQGPSL
jgi:hypothetical protein